MTFAYSPKKTVIMTARMQPCRYLAVCFLNRLNLLKLMLKLANCIAINNDNINSKLQYILQNCNFIEDIIILVSAQLCIAALASVVS
jgi:hypothetical protein